MRTPGGYATIIDPDARQAVQEFDTFTCAHCGGISMARGPNGKPEVMVFRADGSSYMLEAGFCRSCFSHICPRCLGKPCDNRFRRIDRQEAEAQRITRAGGD